MSSQELLAHYDHHRLNDHRADLVRDGNESLGHGTVVLVEHSRDKQHVNEPHNTNGEHEDLCIMLACYRHIIACNTYYTNNQAAPRVSSLAYSQSVRQWLAQNILVLHQFSSNGLLAVAAVQFAISNDLIFLKQLIGQVALCFGPSIDGKCMRQIEERSTEDRNQSDELVL